MLQSLEGYHQHILGEGVMLSPDARMGFPWTVKDWGAHERKAAKRRAKAKAKEAVAEAEGKGKVAEGKGKVAEAEAEADGR